MRQVKIIYANEYYEENEGSRTHVDASITDWEEISDEEYVFLTSNFWQLFQPKVRSYGYEKGRHILLVKDEETISDRIVELRILIQEQLEKDKTRKKKEEASEALKEVKKAEKERKKYELLKQKFEGENNETKEAE